MLFDEFACAAHNQKLLPPHAQAWGRLFAGPDYLWQVHIHTPASEEAPLIKIKLR